MRGVNERIKVRDTVTVGEHVEAVGRRPPRKKLPVADEDGGAAGSVGAVFKIIDATVPQECGAVGVKEDGRERVVLAVHNELALRRAEQRSGQWAGREVRI